MSHDAITYLKTRFKELKASIAIEEKNAEAALEEMKQSWENIAILNIRLDEINYEITELTTADAATSGKPRVGSRVKLRGSPGFNLRNGLSAAGTLNLPAVLQMSEDEARHAFPRIRWPEQNGQPCCGRCGCLEVYVCNAENRWKCKECGYRFSATSGTMFASRKLSFRDLLTAIVMCLNAGEECNMLQLSRDMGVQYKTAFALSHKIRAAVADGNAKRGPAAARSRPHESSAR